MNLNGGIIRVLMLKGEKGDRGDDGTTVTYLLSKVGHTITLTGSDGTTSSVTDDDTTYNDATESEHGLMSTADKTKLNGIEVGAQVNPDISGLVSYTAQSKTTAQRLAALANCGIHVGSTPPENVTTDTVPVGELYAYFTT